MSPVYRLACLSLLVALSLSMFFLEGMLPIPFFVPGAKLGLANLVTVIALYSLPHGKDVFCMLVLRIGMASALGGGPTVFLYSLGGGLLSLGAMVWLKNRNCFSIPCISMAGGFFHNFGQLLVAVLVMESLDLWFYLPVLGGCGIATGWLIGMISATVLRKLSYAKRYTRDR